MLNVQIKDWKDGRSICQNKTFPFSIGKEQDTKTRTPSLELTQPWKIHTTLYQPDYLMNNKTYQDLINYLTTLTYPTDYDDKRKTHLRKNSTQYFVKNHTLYRQNKKVTYE